MSVCVLGSIIMDTVSQVPRLPRPGETVLGESLARHPGGKGANQAVAARAWGAVAQLIGAVAKDSAGDALLDHLRAAGVDTASVAVIAGADTGQAQISVDPDGVNTIVVIPGANARVSADQIRSCDLAEARVFLAQMETPAEVTRTLFETPEARRGTRILNAAPALPAAAALFQLTDILVVNQTELAEFAAADEPADAKAAIPLARRLLDGRPGTVIVTLGADGAVAVTTSEVTAAHGVPATVVDTTGAGDCFCGVLAAGLDGGLDLAEAMTWANRAAAMSVEQAGASVLADLRQSVETRFKVQPRR